MQTITPNLYARFNDSGLCTDVIMPTEALVLPEAPSGDGWHAVQWPVNPHFTGVRLIREMLSGLFPHRTAID